MARRYAEGTKVEVSQSRNEIERLVAKHGATKFASGWAEDFALIEFVCEGRRVRFRLPIGDCDERETRRRWRSLLLAIKSKLEVVNTGIESFDEAFLSHIVTTADVTVSEWMKREADGRLLLPPLPS